MDVSLIIHIPETLPESEKDFVGHHLFAELRVKHRRCADDRVTAQFGRVAPCRDGLDGSMGTDPYALSAINTDSFDPCYL
jgi:hypothetical protein